MTKKGDGSLFWAAGALAVLLGCAPPPAESRPAAPPPPPAPPTEVRLRIADEKDLAAVVTANRGRVVLVDCWATWCGPCREQFPHTVELHRKLAARGLKVISLSCDDPENNEAVLTFLKRHEATFENLLSRYGASEEGFLALNIKTGALPYYILYDRQGNRREELDSGTRTEGLKPAELDQAVERLLAEPAPPS